MTKQEAIQLMKIGVKITHESFSENEWMTYVGVYIKTEDEHLHDPNEFWSYRKGPNWEEGYSEYDDGKNVMSKSYHPIIFEKDRLDDRYTQEEYRLLENLLPEGPVKRDLKRYNIKGYIYLKERTTPFLYKGIANYIKRNTRYMYHIIYWLKFKDLALHINHKGEDCRICVKWRLMIKK